MARPTISEQDLNKMAVSGAKVQREPKIAAAPPAPISPPPPPAPDLSIPFASMQASMGVINNQLGKVVEQNSRVIDALRTEISSRPTEKSKHSAYRHKVVRDRKNLIDYVDSIPLDLK